ncbi:MAG: S8 family serine peptidase [Deltaproteobacteria bacterium]
MNLKKSLPLVCLLACLCSCSSGSSGNNGSADDPLFNQQWHLNNTGQASFSQADGTPGEDLRMPRSIAEMLSGQGVIIAIIDSGLEIAHEDLHSNVIPNGSWNYGTGTTDPSPTNTDGDHGTSVAGIIAAAGFNGKGGRGVAFQASLKGFIVLAEQNEQAYFESMGGHSRSQDVHIFNMSYGADSLSFEPLPVIARELYTSSATLRGGRGGIYVKSAGNGFQDIDISDAMTYRCISEAYGLSTLTCQNATAEEENSRPEVITVGAFNARGVKSSYSTAGANLWISAPGGEYGDTEPAIITSDQSGCDKGYSRSDLPFPANLFEIGDPTYNPACNYTSTFNGTSSAAPNASGAIALMLQVNPNLTRRDVKHILARTARKIDPASPDAVVNVSINGENYLASEGWITNKAGYHFHNWYGFGAVHVDGAVAMARSYQTALPALLLKFYGGTLKPALAIPDNTADGVTQTIGVTDDLTIENFFLDIAIDHPNTGEIGIEVTSPQGTRSILLNIRSGLKTGLNAKGGVIMAGNAFYGENTKGIWTLKVVDSWKNTTGTITNLGFHFLGY